MLSGAKAALLSGMYKSRLVAQPVSKSKCRDRINIFDFRLQSFTQSHNHESNLSLNKMAAAIDTKPLASGLSQSLNVTEPMQKLDDLFEQYLNTVDHYQKARQELSSQLSSGFMSLAQANFSNKGRRYGQDYYDERMQARRMVRVSSSGDEPDLPDFKCEEVTGESSRGNSAAEQEKEEDSPSGKVKAMPKDPLRWFGVLVPPALRSAQASFTTVVESMVPELVASQQKLRALEIEIGRTRKLIKKLGKV
jgi:hypothetical protein